MEPYVLPALGAAVKYTSCLTSAASSTISKLAVLPHTRIRCVGDGEDSAAVGHLQGMRTGEAGGAVRGGVWLGFWISAHRWNVLQGIHLALAETRPHLPKPSRGRAGNRRTRRVSRRCLAPPPDPRLHPRTLPPAQPGLVHPPGNRRRPGATQFGTGLAPSNGRNSRVAAEVHLAPGRWHRP